MEWTPLWTRGGQEEGAPTCRAQSKARGMHLAAAKRRGTAQPDCESTRPATPIGRSIEAKSRAGRTKQRHLLVRALPTLPGRTEPATGLARVREC